MAKSNLEIVITAVDKASKTIDKVSNSLVGKLGKGVIAGAAVGLGAAAAGMGAVGFAAVKLAKDAAPLQGVQDAFEGITEAAGTSADEMLDALKKGSAGMVANRDLMMSFSRYGLYDGLPGYGSWSFKSHDIGQLGYSSSTIRGNRTGSGDVWH